MSVSRVSDATTWLLGRANARAQRLLVEGFAPFDLRPLHYRVLAALDEHGPLSQADLGRHVALDRKDVTVTVDLLAGRGLLERSPDASDRRRVIVSLTATARDLLPQLDDALADVQDRVLAPLTETESQRLRETLARLGRPGVDDAR